MCLVPEDAMAGRHGIRHHVPRPTQSMRKGRRHRLRDRQETGSKGTRENRTSRTSKRALTKRTLRRSTQLTRQQHSLKHSQDKQNSDKRGQRQRRAKTLKLLEVRSPDGPKDSACRPQRAGEARGAPVLKENMYTRPRAGGGVGAGLLPESALKERGRMSLAMSLR